MTDIQAIKKAAEAFKALSDRYAAGELLSHDAYAEARIEYRDAVEDPATVLELCRLAEIGRDAELYFDAIIRCEEGGNDGADVEEANGHYFCLYHAAKVRRKENQK